MENIRLNIQTREIEGLTVLDTAGEIDIYTAPEFKKAIDSVIASGQKHVIINMEKVSYMDSSGFGMLLSATKKVKPSGGSVNLVACSSAIERMLRITKLDNVFKIHASIGEAVDSVKSVKQ